MTPVVQPLPDEPLAVRLLNTRWIGDAGPVDLLADRAGVEGWLASVGLPARTAATTDAVRVALRSARDVLVAVGVDPDDITARTAFNDLLARGAIRRSLRERGTVESAVEVDEAWRAAWLAADDMLRLLTAHPGRLRQCAHPRCVLWFVDTSRNGSRRWCSMAGCGNRAKAQEHYRRRRAATAR